MTDTRISYDTVAEDYSLLVAAKLRDDHVLQGVLAAFAGLVRAESPGRLLDAGCGPGHVTAYLRDAGVDAFGVDLSPRMIEVARREHPGINFDVGSMTSLDLADESVGGVAACWSLIHLPAADIGQALVELRRVLVPGGYLFVGFHIGDQMRRKTSGYGGHPMALDVQLWMPDRLAANLSDVGFELTTRVPAKRRSAVRSPRAC